MNLSPDSQERVVTDPSGDLPTCPLAARIGGKLLSPKHPLPAAVRTVALTSRLLPAALDTLADATRLEAFETHSPRAGHPYHRWRQWCASQMAQAEMGVSSLPQTEAPGSVGESSLPQLGKAPSPEFPVVDHERKELTTAKAPVAIAPTEDKAEARSPYWCPACRVAIPTCPHRTRTREEITASAVRRR